MRTALYGIECNIYRSSVEFHGVLHFLGLTAMPLTHHLLYYCIYCCALVFFYGRGQIGTTVERSCYRNAFDQYPFPCGRSSWSESTTEVVTTIVPMHSTICFEGDPSWESKSDEIIITTIPPPSTTSRATDSPLTTTRWPWFHHRGQVRVAVPWLRAFV